MIKVTRPFKILGSGVYFPRENIRAVDIDRRLQWAEGTAFKTSRIQQRPIASISETPAKMGKWALEAALADAKLKTEDLDLLIMASATFQQPLPYQAAAIHREMGLKRSGLPCFDVNTTCLSFVTALDVASLYVSNGIYKKIAIVSSEAPSHAINWKEPEQATLFGDGAACVIVGEDPEKRSGLSFSLMRTYSEGYETCEVRAGGTNFNFRNPPPDQDHYAFAMNGKVAFKVFMSVLPGFLKDVQESAGKSLADFDWIVPHQASVLGLSHFQKAAKISDQKLINILENHGNQVAASIPIALHHAIKNRGVRSGQEIALFGTSAGLSIACLGFVY